METELLATAEELREFLDLEVDELADDPAERALRRISSSVLGYCRRLTVGFTLAENAVVRLNGNGAYEIVLPGHPVTDVSSVVEDPDGEATELVIGEDVEWDGDGILRRIGARFRCRFRWYEVTYTHGYETIPEAVNGVVLGVAARAIVNPEGLTNESMGGYSAGFAFDDSRLARLSTPDRRELDPYRL